MDRRSFVIGTAAAAAALATVLRLPRRRRSRPRPVTIINAFPPGGVNDHCDAGRSPSTMEPILKQPVVVETKAGAARPGRRAGRVRREAGRLHDPVAQQRHLSATPRSTSCSAAR